jgi:hypothetical protein
MASLSGCPALCETGRFLLPQFFRAKICLAAHSVVFDKNSHFDNFPARQVLPGPGYFFYVGWIVNNCRIPPNALNK